MLLIRDEIGVQASAIIGSRLHEVSLSDVQEELVRRN